MIESEKSSRKTDVAERVLRKFAKTILRFRGTVLLLTLAITVLAVMSIRGSIGEKLTIDNSVEAFLSSNSNALINLERFRDVFGRDDVFLVMVEGDVFSMPYLKKLKAMHRDLASLDLELPSLGQRQGERDLERGRAATNPQAKEPVADDDFGEFETDGDDFADFGDESHSNEGATSTADAWAGQKGGSVFEQITSLINVRKTRYTEDEGLKVGELMDPFPADIELSGLKERVLNDKSLVGQVVNAKGTHSVIVLRCAFMSEEDSGTVDAAIHEISKKYMGDDFKVHIAGMPALGTHLNALMLSDLHKLFVLAIILQFVMMLFLFRHMMGVIGPLIVVALSLIWSFGLMAAMGMPMTMITNILPAFLICVGIGDSVHLQSVYRDARRDGITNNNAIIEAMVTTGTPVFFTSMTTALGLLSFQMASVDAVNELGLIGACGVMMAFMHTMLILPVILSFNKKSLLGAKQKSEGTDFIDVFLNWLASLSGSNSSATIREQFKGRRQTTLLVGFLLSAVALYGASTLKVWHNPLSWVPTSEQIRQSFDALDEHMGGTTTIEVMIEGKTDLGVKHLQVIQGIEKLDAHIRNYIDKDTNQSIVGSVTSLVDIIKETNQALNQGDPAYYKLPETQRGMTDRFTMFDNASPGQLKRMMTLDATQTHISVRIKWLEATAYGGLVDHIQSGVKEYIPANLATVVVTGSAFNLFTTVTSLITDMMLSFGLAFLVITVIMVVLLKSVRLGMIAMVPNLMPVVLILGFMGLVGIPIDMANLLIASVALGVVVDDTIHFLHHFRVHHLQHGEVNTAIAHSMQHSGRAMTSTTIILAAGFLVYLVATMTSLQRFGGLIGMTVGIALLVDLILAPALLRTFYRDRPSNVGTQGDSND